MVATKHCCWGEWTTDSRLPDKWRKSLKRVGAIGGESIHSVPKTNTRHRKVQALASCLFEGFFTEKNITRSTYICVLHWPGEKGPPRARMTHAMTDKSNAKYTTVLQSMTEAGPSNLYAAVIQFLYYFPQFTGIFILVFKV